MLKIDCRDVLTAILLPWMVAHNVVINGILGLCEKREDDKPLRKPPTNDSRNKNILEMQARE